MPPERTGNTPSLSYDYGMYGLIETLDCAGVIAETWPAFERP